MTSYLQEAFIIFGVVPANAAREQGGFRELLFFRERLISHISAGTLWKPATVRRTSDAAQVPAEHSTPLAQLNLEMMPSSDDLLLNVGWAFTTPILEALAPRKR